MASDRHVFSAELEFSSDMVTTEDKAEELFLELIDTLTSDRHLYPEERIKIIKIEEKVDSDTRE